MVLCPALFLSGGLYTGYGGVAPVTCKSLDRFMSMKMLFLGSTILHEYMHFGALLQPQLTIRPIDHKYNPYNVRVMDKRLAIENADSYMWYALEMMWSTHCGWNFGDPKEEEDD